MDGIYGKGSLFVGCRLGVISAILTVVRLLPVFPQLQTGRCTAITDAMCQQRTLLGGFVLVGLFRRPHYRCIVHPLPWELPAGRAEVPICL